MQRGIAVIHDMIVLDELAIIGTDFGESCSEYTQGFDFATAQMCLCTLLTSKHLVEKGPLDSVHTFWAVLVPGLSDNALVTSFFVL